MLFLACSLVGTYVICRSLIQPLFSSACLMYSLATTIGDILELAFHNMSILCLS